MPLAQPRAWATRRVPVARGLEIRVETPAVDYESLAAQGRQFSQAILTVEPRQAKSWKGPVTRQHGTFVRRRYPFRQNSEHAAPWLDQRALTVLIGESALRRDVGRDQAAPRAVRSRRL